MAEHTEKTQKDKLDRLAKLADAFRANQAKGYELFEEMQAVLAEEATPGQLARRALETFGKLWTERYKAKFLASHARDLASLKRILKTLSVEDIEGRMRAYLKDQDRFIASTNHSLPLFVSSANKYANASRPPDPPTDCTHEPSCRSDVEHTKRRNEQLRGLTF